MAKRVHIKIADRGWILEKCAREIADRSAGVSFGTEPDPSADLQYYINYSARSRRVSAVEVAFFTHSEFDENARRRYFEAARQVDHCVCMSDRYAKELLEYGIPGDKITTIAPGVDLDEFRPKIRVGVVGRTYHTGRKGEALVAQVMDVPGIEWRFTGSGWPGPSVHVPDGGMPDFYNDLDYVLVPSLYEGGPMSVLEGLACGVPIISSDVGWVSEYPHIPFETGNADSLRRVLAGLVAEREALRSPVLERTWSSWAEQHLQLFERLLGGSLATGPVRSDKAGQRTQAALVIHSENKSLGGPSVRVPRTASELAAIGVTASLAQEHADDFDSGQLAHIFNVWPADSCFRAIDRARAVGKRTILSPIFLNLANMALASRTLPRLFSEGRSVGEIDSALSEIAKEIEQEPNLPTREPFEGYHERARICIESADEVIFLSDYERRCIEHIGAKPRSESRVRNPVDAASFANADPGLFAEKYGLDEYILCVGRIEPRKNQLVLAHAAKTLGKTIVFIGHTQNQPYFDLVREAAGASAHFIPRIDPANPLLKSAFAGASVFCLPSWAEGAPLAALEAAAAGAPLVLSDRSSEQEYFASFAEYVNPADVAGLRHALEAATAKRGDNDRRTALQKHVADSFNWQDYARSTAEVYKKASSLPTIDRSLPKTADGPIYFDLTTTCHTSGNPTGIARVEDRAFRAMVATYGDRIIPVAWNSRTKSFVRLSRARALVGVDVVELERAERSGEISVLSESDVRGGRILVLGGAWIRNAEYIAALRGLKLTLRANLTVLIHDLIQMKLAHIYPEGVGSVFEENARGLAEVADDFLVYSESTKSDLAEFLRSNALFFKKISKFRLGDITGLHTTAEAADSSDLPPVGKTFEGKQFAVYVSSIEIRKNHALLINVWRRLVEERGSAAPHLVCIGRPLWRGAEVVESIKRDQQLSQYVHILEDVDDRELDWFYRNSLLTLYPSLYEGWGLPVAESLSYGKLCIASDRTSTREVAPGLTELLDPYDFRAWRDRVAFYLDNPDARERAEARIRSEYKERSWEESVSEIVSTLDQLPNAKVESAFVFPGEVIEFYSGSRRSVGLELCANGWGNAEQGGRWSVGPASKLAFRYSAKGAEFRMRLRLRALTRPGEETRGVRVRINDQVDEVLEISGTPSTIDLTIPVRRPAGAAYSDNEILFEPLELLSPSMTNASADTRMLGVYLIAAQVADSTSGLVSPLSDPPNPSPTAGPVESLAAARELVTLPARFTGKGPLARFARATGFDKLWLRIHGRRFRRAYSSIGIIVSHLERERRT